MTFLDIARIAQTLWSDLIDGLELTYNGAGWRKGAPQEAALERLNDKGAQDEDGLHIGPKDMSNVKKDPKILF